MGQGGGSTEGGTRWKRKTPIPFLSQEAGEDNAEFLETMQRPNSLLLCLLAWNPYPTRQPPALDRVQATQLQDPPQTYMHTHTHTHVPPTYVHGHTEKHVCTRMLAYRQVCRHTGICAHMHSHQDMCKHAHIHTDIRAHMHAHTEKRVHTHAHTGKCANVHTDMCIRPRLHTNVCVCTPTDMCTHAYTETHVRAHSTIPSGSYFATFLDFNLGSCWPTSPRGCTFPWDTGGHLGESLAKTGEAKQPRLRNLLKDRAMRALGGALGCSRGQGCSAEASLASVSEGPGQALDPLASPFCSELSKATLMGEGQMALLGLRMKRPGEGKGLLGERQDGEKGLEGEGGTQVPVYTAR